MIEVERMVDLEQRFGLILKGINAWQIDEREIRVCGEIEALAAIRGGLRVVVSIHDAKGRVIGASDEYDCTIDPKLFRKRSMFGTSIDTNSPADEAVKARVYVQPLS